MSFIHNRNKYLLGCLLAFSLSFGRSYAQLYGGFSSQYFQNNYLYNPAYAGAKSNLSKIWMNYKASNMNTSGAMKSSALTVDGPIGDTYLGYGVLYSDDRSGNFVAQRALGSLSYLIEMEKNRQLRFGLSLGYFKETYTVGDNPDVSDVTTAKLAEYNALSGMWDGNFGAVFIYDQIEIAAGMPSFKFFNNKSLDHLICYVSAGYKLISDEFIFTPLIYGQLYKQNDYLLDVGGQIVVNEKLMFLGMLSTNSRGVVLGFGYDGIENVSVNFSYSVSTYSKLSNFGGIYEIGISCYPFNMWRKLKNMYQD